MRRVITQVKEKDVSCMLARLMMPDDVYHAIRTVCRLALILKFSESSRESICTYDFCVGLN